MNHEGYPKGIACENGRGMFLRLLPALLASVLLPLGACNGDGSLSVNNGRGDAAVNVEPVSPDTAPPAIDLAPVQTGTVEQIADNGKLSGGLSGYAWVAGGTGTTWISPNPCNDQGCFKDTGGKLCASGSIAALTCTNPGTPQITCDWDANWGAMIGWNATPVQHVAWGAAATSGIAVTYAGGPGEYRLMAHIAGDPDTKVYCVERYISGQVEAPAAFLSECWNGAGDVLPDFSVVETFGIQLISAQAPIDFDFCISNITLN